MRLLALALALALVALALGARADEALPPANDPGQLAPEAFRARFRVTSEGVARDVELYRSGPDLSLVRFLGAEDHGKFLLRRGGTTWLVSPRAKKPVKLGNALKLAGASALDLLASTAYGRDYAVATRSDEGGRTRWRLKARPEATGPRLVDLVVDGATGRPVRIDSLLPQGRLAATLEIGDWPAQAALPGRLVFRDALRGGVSDVQLVDVAVGPVDAALFDLDDGAARRGLDVAP